MNQSKENSPKKVWVFCFEYAGIAKVGGLGEVSANQCRSLAPDEKLDLEVFMPSHNRHLKFKKEHGFKPMKDQKGNILTLKGHFDPSYFGITMGNELHARTMTKFQSFTDMSYFEAELWTGVFKGVQIHLVVGKNTISKEILNDADVYSSSTLNAKLGLFSHCMKEYMRYCIFEEPKRIPDIIHIHDHHPVPAMLCCRQELLLKGKDVRTIITMHLLTWPRRDLEFYWKSGVNNEPMITRVAGGTRLLKMRDVYNMAKGARSGEPTVEKVGCLFADEVIAVSENFLHSEIIPNCGGDLIEPKTNFTWNGCDWEYEEHRDVVWNSVKENFPKREKSKVRSWDLRKLLLTEKIGNLPSDEPIFSSEEVRTVVSEEFKGSVYNKDCTVENFDEDGPMVLLTGRASPQKGIDVVFHALPYVIKKIPDVKFVFLMIPTPYNLDQVRFYMDVARNYPNNVRFIFGIAKSIYLLAHHSADLYCCPSKWEPFGIVALEAMASKIPVVATYVGGLQESILHLEDHPKKGTGLLCPNMDSEALKFAIVSMLTVMELNKVKTKDPTISLEDLKDKMELILHPKLKEQVKRDLKFGEKIRENCYHRVDSTFRWDEVSQQLMDIYMRL